LYPKLHLWTTVTNKTYNSIFIEQGFNSSLEFAKKILLESAFSKSNNSNQLWGQKNLQYNFTDNFFFKINIKDEDRKFPLNTLFSQDYINPISEKQKKIFERLTRYARFPVELNDITKLWEERIKIFHSKVNLLTFEEFISFSQFSYKNIFNEEFLPLTEFVTVYSTGKININTIIKEVFLSLSDLLTEQSYNSLQNIINSAGKDGIKTVSELARYSEFENVYEEIKDFLTTESTYFVVEATVFYEGEEAKKRFLLKKITENNKVKFIKIATLIDYKYQSKPDVKRIKE
jgi:type II secretory pathway component PulK